MNILIATHQELLQTGLRALLDTELGRANLPGPHIFHPADSVFAAIDICRQCEVELVLVDLDMPELDWPACIAELRDALPEGAPLAALYGGNDPRMVAEAYSRGVVGVLPKTLPNRLVIRALGLIAEGGTYLPDITMRVREPMGIASAKPSLTQQQSRVLQMIAGGMSNKEIARELNISEGTVKLHVTAIIKFTGARNRVGAAMLAAQMGLSRQPAHC